VPGKINVLLVVKRDDLLNAFITGDAEKQLGEDEDCFFAQFQGRVDANGAGYERNYWIHACYTKKHSAFQKWR